jgi:integrase/recombinase XerD
MSPLRQRLVDDLRLRNYSPRTIQAYVAAVARLAKHFGRSPDQLSLDDLRAFQLHMIDQEKTSWSRFNVTVSGLRFFFKVTLGRAEAIEQLPYGRRPKTLPVVLSREEVALLLAAVTDERYRLMLRLAYGCGLRIGEVARLQVGDIDSGRMVLIVKQGKGQKDRLVPLSPGLLEELRTHWRRWRPASWLFAGSGAAGHLHIGGVQRACQQAAKACGLTKKVSPHTLRHCYATHLLEAGVDLLTLKELLGHRDLSTTTRYTHVTSKVRLTPSPLDSLPVVPVAPCKSAPPPPVPEAPKWLEDDPGTQPAPPPGAAP